MTEKLYVLTGNLKPENLGMALGDRGKVSLYVEQYARIGEGHPFRKVWVEPARIDVRVDAMTAGHVYVDNGTIIELDLRVGKASSTRTIEGLELFGDGNELYGLHLSSVLCEHAKKVGVISHGFRIDKSEESETFRIDAPKLELATPEHELRPEDELRAMGLPENLIECRNLLCELGLVLPD